MQLRKDKTGIYLPGSWNLVTIISSKSKLGQSPSYCNHGSFPTHITHYY